MTSHLDLERIAARLKSYTGAAVIAFCLYWLFWPAGLVLNYIYMQEAKKMEGLAGHSLPGQGCLSLLFWLNLVLFVLSLCGLFLVFVLALAGQ